MYLCATFGALANLAGFLGTVLSPAAQRSSRAARPRLPVNAPDGVAKSIL